MQQQQKLASRTNVSPQQQLYFSGFLPSGVMENILLQLPVKALIRFKAVCKSWKEILSSPYFTRIQLNHARKHQKLLCYALDWQTFIPKISYVGGTNEASGNERVLTPSQFNLIGGVTLEDSCDGLLSFRFASSRRSIYLWNPATRKSRHVHLPDWDPHPCVGIAFAAKTSQYKMVRTSFNFGANWRGISSSSLNRLCIWVYSIKFDSWKKLIPDVGYGPLYAGSAISLAGCMHWITDDRGAHIASFDVDNETLNYFPMPSIEESQNFYRKHLVILRESLSVVVAYMSTCYGFACDIWQMKEYGVGTSWIKVAFIESFPRMPYPCGYYADEKILLKFYLDDHAAILSCDPFNGVRTYLNVPGNFGMQIVTYIETMVSLELENSNSPNP